MQFPSCLTTGEPCRFSPKQEITNHYILLISLSRHENEFFQLGFSQCARRWFDEGQKSHLVNLGKYVSAMLAAGTKVAYEKERSAGWLCLVVVMSSVATMYQLYWDFVKDWGLLQMNSKNPWLRNELMLRRKIIYYISMVLCSSPLMALLSFSFIRRVYGPLTHNWRRIININIIKY